MKKILSILSAVFILNPGQVLVWSAEISRLHGIEVRPDEVRIRTSKSTSYNAFVTANPPRLILELPDTQYRFNQKSLAGSGKWIKQVRSGQFQKEPLLTRVVLDLIKMVPYQISPQPNEIIVTLTDVAPRTLSSNPPPQNPSVAQPQSSTDLDITKELNGEQKDKDLEEVKMAALPSPVKIPIVTPKSKGPVDIIATLSTDPITLDFDATDVRDALQLLASKAGFNVIYGADVIGTITLHLIDVPFNEAFKTILSMKGLATAQVGNNILRIASPQTLIQERQSALAVTKVVPLKYSSVASIKTQVDAVLSAEGLKGTTTSDTNNNALIITATPDAIESISRLIAQVDQRPKQVLIEAKLVEVNLNKDLQLGIQWDYFQIDNGKFLGKQGLSSIGTDLAPNASPFSKPFDVGTLKTQTPPVGSSARGTGVFLPADRVFGALTLGRVTDNYFLNATLSAAASSGKVKVLSDPKVATLNNQSATINITTQIPYVTSNVASTGVTTQSVSYVTVGIILTVTPTVNADGRVTLKVNPSVSQPSATAASAGTTGAPAVDSRNANTTVMVKDGETIVIGGLISDRVSDTIAKVPLLGDIPILGWLFKKKSTSRSRFELLIFVTTKIMPD
ncbi:MAG: type IV pilus secretin PilQ [Elusimicrobia bacterium]|nr:type IV pilus secretin PilQ [Elusimicrobiota bacterium]